MMRNRSVTYLRAPAPSAVPDPFHAVADPTRRAILDRLRRGDAPVTELASGFAMSRPAVSRHLRVLREARLVCERRGGADGRQRVYQLTPDPLRDVAQWAMAYEAFWPANLASLKRHLERAPATAPASPPRSEERDP
jgi:DNA-binding transcriptional ArsR family regulator